MGKVGPRNSHSNLKANSYLAASRVDGIRGGTVSIIVWRVGRGVGEGVGDVAAGHSEEMAGGRDLALGSPKHRGAGSPGEARGLKAAAALHERAPVEEPRLEAGGTGEAQEEGRGQGEDDWAAAAPAESEA